MLITVLQGIIDPIVDRLDKAVSNTRINAAAGQPQLIQAITALTACFKGLSPSDDDIFDLADVDDDGTDKQDAVDAIRDHSHLIALRIRIEGAVNGVVQVWSGDGEVADVRDLESGGYFLTFPGDLIISQARNPLFLRDAHLTLAASALDPCLFRRRALLVRPMDVAGGDFDATSQCSAKLSYQEKGSDACRGSKAYC